MKALIIDNEVNIISGMEKLIKVYCPSITSIRSARDISGGVEEIREFNPNVVFLDVELDYGTGLDLLDHLDKIDFELIFMTAYNKYALKAFKYSAIDFLLKPVDPDDLVSAVNKAKEMIQKNEDQLRYKVLMENVKAVNRRDKKIILNSRDKIHALPISDIIFLKADGPYTIFQMKDQSIMSSKHLKSYEDMLEEVGFCRIHHSYLANLYEIQGFDKSEFQLEMSNGMSIPVSKRKKDGLLQKIRNHLRP